MSSTMRTRYSGVPQAKNTRLHTTRAAFFSCFGSTKYRMRLTGRNTNGKTSVLNAIASPPYSAPRNACCTAAGVLMDDEQNIVAPDIQNGVIRQQVILLQAVAVEAGLLRFEPGLHGGADSLLLRRIAQLEQQKLLGLHVCLRVIEQAAVKIGRIQAVQAA